jgi:outer membrane protein assembly factor BamD
MTKKLLSSGLLAACAACALTLGSGCRGGFREDPVLALGVEESLDQGKAWMEREKFGEARRYLLHAFEVEPNSVQGREALLLAADSYYLDGGSQNWIQAEAKYRDFQNRFPTSDRAPYVQFQIARALAARMERPDRDQSTATKALKSFEDLVRLFPTSEYALKAEDEIRRLRDNLAEHEYRVAVFYLRYGIPVATVGRLERLLDQFPDFHQVDKVLYQLGLGYLKSGQLIDAHLTFERLARDYPSSAWVKEIPPLPPLPPAPPATPAETPAAAPAPAVGGAS